jgi:hypothetical protein
LPKVCAARLLAPSPDYNNTFCLIEVEYRGPYYLKEGNCFPPRFRKHTARWNCENFRDMQAHRRWREQMGLSGPLPHIPPPAPVLPDKGKRSKQLAKRLKQYDLANNGTYTRGVFKNGH